jgi:hypothetical protein
MAAPTYLTSGIAAAAAAKNKVTMIEIQVTSPLAWLSHPMTYDSQFGLFGNKNLLTKYQITEYNIVSKTGDIDDTLKAISNIPFKNNILDKKSPYYTFWNQPVLMNGNLTNVAKFVINNLEKKQYTFVVKTNRPIVKVEFLKDLYQLKVGGNKKTNMIQSLWGGCLEINEKDDATIALRAAKQTGAVPAAAPAPAPAPEPAAAPAPEPAAAPAPPPADPASAPVRGQYTPPMGAKSNIEVAGLAKKAAESNSPQKQKAYMDTIKKRYPQAKGEGGKSWVSGIMASAGLSASAVAALLVLL